MTKYIEKKFYRKSALIIIAASLMAQPAQACWNKEAVDAAKIMNLNNMFMVTALQCRKGSHNFLPEYNHFVKGNATQLSVQHGIVKRYLAREHGAKGADLALDRFNIGLANSFGAGHPSMKCDQLKTLAHEASLKKNTTVSLVAFADRWAGAPSLPGGACKTRVASNNR